MRYNVYSISSFKKSLRHLAKKYPHVKEDLEEVVQLLSQFPDIGTAIYNVSEIPVEGSTNLEAS